MKTTLLCIILFITVSCSKSDDDNVATPTPITPVVIIKGLDGIDFNTLTSYFNSFTNANDWATFASTYVANLNINPNIDFSKFDVVVCVDSLRTQGGYDIAINSIIENEQNIVVTVQNVVNGNASLIPTRPFIIAEIPKTNKPIAIHWNPPTTNK